MADINIVQDDFRPTEWDAYIGQEQLKSTLQLHCDAAVKRIEPLSHVFLGSPAGFGKTTIANLIAKRLNEEILSITMPVKRMVIFRAVREHQGVLFLDELHRASKRDQEDLLTILESGYIQLDGGGWVQNKWLTVIGATTETQTIVPAVLDRFPIRPHFESYTDEELTLIVRGMAERIKLTLEDSIIEGIGLASGGVPRVARSLVMTARDLQGVDGAVDMDKILTMKQLTPDGLTRDHINYLNLLYQQDGRAGMSTLSSMLRLHPRSVIELERLLIMRKFIVLTRTGREILPDGYKYLNDN